MVVFHQTIVADILRCVDHRTLLNSRLVCKTFKHIVDTDVDLQFTFDVAAAGLSPSTSTSLSLLHQRAMLYWYCALFRDIPCGLRIEPPRKPPPQSQSRQAKAGKEDVLCVTGVAVNPPQNMVVTAEAVSIPRSRERAIRLSFQYLRPDLAPEGERTEPGRRPPLITKLRYEKDSNGDPAISGDFVVASGESRSVVYNWKTDKEILTVPVNQARISFLDEDHLLVLVDVLEPGSTIPCLSILLYNLRSTIQDDQPIAAFLLPKFTSRPMLEGSIIAARSPGAQKPKCGTLFESRTPVALIVVHIQFYDDNVPPLDLNVLSHVFISHIPFAHSMKLDATQPVGIFPGSECASGKGRRRIHPKATLAWTDWVAPIYMRLEVARDPYVLIQNDLRMSGTRRLVCNVGTSKAVMYMLDFHPGRVTLAMRECASTHGLSTKCLSHRCMYNCPPDTDKMWYVELCARPLDDRWLADPRENVPTTMPYVLSKITPPADTPWGPMMTVEVSDDGVVITDMAFEIKSFQNFLSSTMVC